MRKITLKKQREKKERKNQIVLGTILALLMIFSLGGYALMSGSRGGNTENEIITYNQIEFIRDSGNWYFNLYGYDFETRYNPKELENTSEIIFNSLNNSNFTKTLLDYQNKPLYFSGDSENFINCFYEINKNINPFILRQQLACLENEPCSKDLPIKSCEEDNIIIIKRFEEPNLNSNGANLNLNDSNSNSEGANLNLNESKINSIEIYQKENCVFIITNEEDSIKACDLFLFKILGIY